MNDFIYVITYILTGTLMTGDRVVGPYRDSAAVSVSTQTLKVCQRVKTTLADKHAKFITAGTNRLLVSRGNDVYLVNTKVTNPSCNKVFLPKTSVKGVGKKKAVPF